MVDVPGLCKVGLSICYDVRFPELYRHLIGAGADLLMIPAAFTAFTERTIGSVLQARAIENTAACWRRHRLDCITDVDTAMVTPW